MKQFVKKIKSPSRVFLLVIVILLVIATIYWFEDGFHTAIVPSTPKEINPSIVVRGAIFPFLNETTNTLYYFSSQDQRFYSYSLGTKSSLAVSEPIENLYDIRWSPDGKIAEILYLTGEKSFEGTDELAPLIFDLNSGKLMRVEEQRTSLVWNGNGTKTAFLLIENPEAYDGKGTLFVGDKYGQNPTPVLVLPEDLYYSHPLAWIKDDQILLGQKGDVFPNPYPLILFDLKTNQAKRLEHLPSLCYWPELFVNDLYIACTLVKEGGIVFLPLAESLATKVLPIKEVSSSKLCAERDGIIFCFTDKDGDLIKVILETGAIQNLGKTGLENIHPVKITKEGSIVTWSETEKAEGKTVYLFPQPVQ